jgi:hypothetical protein
MLKWLFWSLRKSYRLRKISKKLRPVPDSGDSFAEQFASWGFDAITPRLDDLDMALKELSALANEDPEVSRLILQHRLEEDELKDIYKKLVHNRAGVYTNGHWVPASALVFAAPLEYILRHINDEDFQPVAFRVRSYFDHNETGEIED